ncbi:SDR family oxidoreductase [Sphingobacteriaceae bacterium]|nr:SDR family oxidoreductase [Sphingobacteriaceae bacterium]
MRIFITGGASGLGEAITKKLAGVSSNEVYFTYNSSGDNAQKIKSEFENTYPVRCNFNNEEELKNLCTKIEEISPDVLINNAYTGSFINSYFHKTDANDFLSEFKINVLSTIMITQAALTVFRKKKGGKIITVLTSALVNTPPIGSSVYVANKAYLEELTKVWAVENARFNITSNSVSPAFMLTSFTNAIDERLIEQMTESHPLKKLLDPAEVAETILFLSTAGTQLNGVNLVINAAATLK